MRSHLKGWDIGMGGKVQVWVVAVLEVDAVTGQVVTPPEVKGRVFRREQGEELLKVCREATILDAEKNETCYQSEADSTAMPTDRADAIMGMIEGTGA